MRYQAGLSLIELSAVVAILGIIALVVVPQYSSTDLKKLDLAAHAVAEAMRFARSEAIRTGELRGVLVDTGDTVSAGKDVAVFLPKLDVSPFGVEAILTHPVSKQPFDRWIGRSSTPAGVGFLSAAAPFSFEGVSGARNYLFFSAEGTPVWLEDNALSRFTGGDVQLSYAGRIARVSVAPLTGRVTVQ